MNVMWGLVLKYVCHSRSGVSCKGRLHESSELNPYMTSPHENAGTETVHVDVSILSELLRKLSSQHGVVRRREVTQGVPQGQLNREGETEIFSCSLNIG